MNTNAAELRIVPYTCDNLWCDSFMEKPELNMKDITVFLVSFPILIVNNETKCVRHNVLWAISV